MTFINGGMTSPSDEKMLTSTPQKRRNSSVRRQTVAGIPFIDSKWMKGHPRISAMIPNKLRKADSEQNFLAAHADVFENYDSRRKSSSLPRSPRAEIEKRLTAIDQITKSHSRRNSASNFPRRAANSESSQSESYENEFDGANKDLIQMTTQQLEDRQREEESLRHQIRKISEEKNILHDRLDELKKHFLELNPRKDQKARVDAAYEKQKSKLKAKIGQLDKKKAHLENKLKSSKDDDKNAGFRPESNHGFSEISSDDVMRPQDFQNSESTQSLHANLTTKNSNISLASMDSKVDSKSLCSSENESGVVVPGNFGTYEQLIEQVSLLMKFKEHYEEMMEFRQKEYEKEIREVSTTTEKNRQYIETTTELANDRIDQLESEIHEHSDLRTSEFTRLKQDIDQQWNMVHYRSNERNNEIIERLEKVETRLDELAAKIRNNREVEKSNAVSAPGFKTGIEILVHLFGLILMLIQFLQSVFSPFTRTLSRTVASILFLVLSMVLWKIFLR